MFNLPKAGEGIPQSKSKEMEDQLAYNPITQVELLLWNDTNRKPFASISYEFLLLMLSAALWVNNLKWKSSDDTAENNTKLSDEYKLSML